MQSSFTQQKFIRAETTFLGTRISYIETVSKFKFKDALNTNYLPTRECSNIRKRVWKPKILARTSKVIDFSSQPQKDVSTLRYLLVSCLSNYLICCQNIPDSGNHKGSAGENGSKIDVIPGDLLNLCTK